jgi:hypothetical protein
MGPATDMMPSNPGTVPLRIIENRNYDSEKKKDKLPLAPTKDTLPPPGFKEYRPQYAAGILKLPPMSDPMPIADPSIARRAASPPELPPHV